MSNPPASQINRLIEHVRRRHDATEDEILDLLWCLERGHLRWGTVVKVKPTPEPETKRNLPVPPERPPDTTGRLPERPPVSGPEGDAGAAGGETDETTQESKPSPEEVQLFHEGGARWDRNQEREASDNGEGLTSVRIAGAVALGGESDLLARALRPLQTRRQIRPGELDEARTVDNAVQWGYPLPAWKQDRSTPFVLTVVIDGSRSNGFWTAWAEAWCQVLRVGSRARVDVWHLSPDASGSGFLISSRPGGRGAVPHVVERPVPRRQILLFSDMVAPWWFSGHLPALLGRWARVHTVTVVTPVPPRVWERNAVAEFRRGIARVPHQRRARWVDWDGERPEEPPVFLLRMERAAVAGWAETVTGRGSAGHLALAFPANEPSSPFPKLSEPQEHPALPLKTLKLRLERAVEGGILSKAACDLVEVLAAAPLTPGLMRLVQRGSFPGQSHEVLAEVVYSRLIARQGAQLSQKDPDRVLYDFYAVEGVPDEEGWLRRELMRERRWDQLEKVQTCVGNYLEDHLDLDLHAIEALVLRQGVDAATALPDGWEPFARVLGQVWQHLGGTRAEKGTRILKRVGRSSVTTAQDDRPTTLINSIGMTMLGIPGGIFQDTSAPPGISRPEELVESFWLARTPVTQRQWKTVMGASVLDQYRKGNAYGAITGTDDDHPIYFVSWNEALEFCDRLTRQDHESGVIPPDQAYSLPRNVQWEYACRAGTNARVYREDVSIDDLAWHSGNSERTSHPVGQKLPNAWGLYDCLGNVAEWCAEALETGSRVICGGSRMTNDYALKSDLREAEFPSRRRGDIGFRPVLAALAQREALGELPPEVSPPPLADSLKRILRQLRFLIEYLRSGTPEILVRLQRSIERTFDSHCFWAAHDITMGENWDERLESEWNQADIILVPVLNDEEFWSGEVSRSGQYGGWVHLVKALESPDRMIVPLLFDGARIESGSLSPALKPLVDRKGVTILSSQFDHDVAKLVEAIALDVLQKRGDGASPISATRSLSLSESSELGANGLSVVQQVNPHHPTPTGGSWEGGLQKQITSSKLTPMKIFVWPVENSSGAELLAQIRPIVANIKDATLELPGSGDDRLRLVRAIKECSVVVCDCSVEPGHLYHKYVELPKVNNHVIICSRTPLPRNVYAFHQIAPTHGSTLTNGEIARQLTALVPAVAESGASQHGYWERMAQSFDAQIRSAEDRIGLFTSYRGRLESAVQSKAAEVAERIRLKSRVVPKGEFAYETECMTRQMMWATVARLEQEIHYARAFLLIKSEDYFDSFWTATEYFIARLFHELPTREIQNGFFVTEDALRNQGALQKLSIAASPITPQQRRQYADLLRQSDPGVVAPEMRRPQSGVTGLLFKVISTLTGHSRAPSGDHWWNTVLVPCPNCRPRHRTEQDIDWEQHFAISGYGYFPVARAALTAQKEITVRCPGCEKEIALVNRRQPRTMWIPGPLGRPWPPEMEMIDYEPLWEAVG